MRTGLVSQWYDPEVGSAVLPGTIARALDARGHDVAVLTGFPNYPSGALYPGYRLRPYQRECRGQITVHRSPLFVSHDQHAVRRSASYLTFAAAATAVGLRYLRDRDALLVYSSPATAALPAMALRRLSRIPYVLHIQDMWPQSVTDSGFLSGRRADGVGRALHRFCDAAYRNASAIAVTSPGMARLVEQRGVDPARVHLVSNWVDEQVFRPGDRALLADELGPFAKFTVMYAGNLGELQGLGVVIDAAEMLADRTDIGFVFVGGGVVEADLRAAVVERRLANVRFIPPQPPERMADVLALGDVQLITLRDTALLRLTLPSKVQATLAAGRPVLASVAGDAAAVVTAAGAGRVVPPQDAEQLAAAVVDLAAATPLQRKAMGDAGRAYYRCELSEETGAERLERLLVEAAERGQS